jgi:prepilin-type N-terminal cleavage/methylation domain-containing protein
MQNAEQDGSGKGRMLRNRRSFCNLHSAKAAFTLIELLVAVGLMAILLTMIATIFSGATQAFLVARASIQIHESARAALNALVNDLTAAEFTSYDNGVQGYFALSQGPTDHNTGSAFPAWSSTVSYAVNTGVSSGGVSYICIAANPSPSQSPPNATYWRPMPVAANGTAIAADTLTFTTLASQPGARYAAPEAVEQLALVRYALEFDGGSATLPGSHTARPTFNLVKRVRFPNTGNPALNMDDFNVTDLQMEVNPSDPNWTQYARSEPIAFHVLSMNVRLFCLPEKATSETSEVFLETGTATSTGTSTQLYDSTKNWTSNFHSTNPGLRIYAGTGAGQGPLLVTSSGNTLSVSTPFITPYPASGSLYRVDDTLYAYNNSFGTATASSPGWCQRGSYNFFGTTYRPPAIVEVTLEMTDVHATRSFIFTQRFYIPASER